MTTECLRSFDRKIDSNSKGSNSKTGSKYEKSISKSDSKCEKSNSKSSVANENIIEGNIDHLKDEI